MFRRISGTNGALITVFVDGTPLQGRQGDSVAGLLLASDKAAFRKSAVSGATRGPYCMMGVCFDCLVRIDGLGNRQGCMTPIREGMRIETGRGRTEVVT